MNNGRILLSVAFLVVFSVWGCGNSYQTIHTHEVATESSPKVQVSSSVSPESDSLQRIGEKLFFAGRYEQASQIFYKAIVVSPDSWKARFYLGLIATETGNFAVAESWFDQALTNVTYDGATRAIIYTSRAAMHELAGNPARALLDYRTAANLDPTNIAATEGQSRLSASIGSANQPK